MRKFKFRKITALVLVFAMMIGMSGNVFAEEMEKVDTELQQIPKFSYEEIMDARTSSGDSFQFLTIAGTEIVSRYKNGNMQVAYTYGENVYTDIYQDGILLDSSKEIIDIPEPIIMTTQEQARIDDAWNDSTYTVESINENLIIQGVDNYIARQYDQTICIVPTDDDTTFTTSESYDNYDELILKAPAKTQETVLSGTFYCNRLLKNIPISIRDTVRYHTITQYKPYYWATGVVAVTSIAKAALTSDGRAIVAAILDALIDVSGKFIENINFRAGDHATTENMRQAFVYDTTQLNRYVSVHTSYADQRYAFTNQGSGYKWGVLAPDFFNETCLILDAKAEGIKIYNYIVDQYGYWIHGDL